MKFIKNIKLAIFDFDSTLMNGETIDLLAEKYGVKQDVSEITKLAMEGKLDFFESLIKRVSLLKGMKVSDVDEVCSSLPYMKGAKKLISDLKEQGIKVVCFSGGFKNATSKAKDLLGFDEDFSNTLHSKDGVLTGLVGGEMMFSDSKGNMLLKLQNILNVSPAETLVVGDGANDLSMFEHANYKAAFCAKEILKKEANIVIDDLSSLMLAEEI